MWQNLNLVKPRRKNETSQLFESTMYPVLNLPNEDGSKAFPAILNSVMRLYMISDVKELFDEALRAMLGLIHASWGSIFLWDAASKELVLESAVGPYEKRVRGTRIKLREGISGWVAEKGLSVLVKDIEHDLQFRKMHKDGKYRSGSFMSIPMLSGSKLLGVINVTERENLMPFTEADFCKVQAVARHLSIAYENLRMKDHLEQEKAEAVRAVDEVREQLTEREPVKELGKRAFDVIEDINVPLEMIRRYVQLAMNKVPEGSQARTYLLKANSGIRRTAQIIRGLLSFSRESKQAKRIVDLQALLDRSIAAAAQTPSFHEIRFEKSYTGSPVFVVDAGLRTVFKNLFDNAAHAMKGKGSLILSLRTEGENAVVTVRDTGSGIPKEIGSRIFEPFFTTKDKNEGTGIGLAICRDIVQRSGGEITFESEEGAGTTFLITLPYKDNREEI